MIAVTGASGFIGGRIARALSLAGHKVCSFGRRSPEQLSAHVPDYSAWDIADGSRDLHDVSAIVHCAAHVRMWGSERQFEAANVQGTRNVVASIPGNARIVYISSASVHHKQSAADLSPYARTKLLGESIAQECGHHVTVLRPHIVYGPGDSTLWPRVLKARRGTKLFVPGTGTNRVSVTHVDNLVEAVKLSLTNDAPHGTFDIADAEAPTVRELIETMFTRHNETVRIVPVPRALAAAAATLIEAGWRWCGREDDPPLTHFVVQNLADPFVLDISPAMSQLGYAPQFNIHNGPL